MWRKDGSFYTWIKPTPRTDQENFYPGEALFYWAALFEHTAVAATSHQPGKGAFKATEGTDLEGLLQKFVATFRYYREWHLQPANRNPAFVPWHTQALYQMWRTLGALPLPVSGAGASEATPMEIREQKRRAADLRFEILDFVVEMNDWLVATQQWEWNDSNGEWNDGGAGGGGGDSSGPLFHDIQGRFYKPGANYGAPHASATGVYIEGLAESYRMVVEARAEQAQAAKVGALGPVFPIPRRTAAHLLESRRLYARSLVRAMRSAITLQFQDDTDMFYVKKADRPRNVRGGIRTTVYNNEIRVDNVQHIIMGSLNMLDAFDEFDESFH